MGKSSDVVHRLEADNDFSKSEEATKFWLGFYRAAFDNFLEMSETIENRRDQNRGIDRIVSLTNGDVFLLDEKLRREHHPDIFLEYESNDVRGIPGWLNKDLDIDYIAYGWLSVGIGYLIEWQSLASAWFRNQKEWMTAYPNKPSQNEGYTTWGVCIPTKVIVSNCQTRCVIIPSEVKTRSAKKMEPVNLAGQLRMFE